MQVELPPYPGDSALQQQLEASGGPLVSRVWEEPELCVVLGRGNQYHRELHVERIEEEELTVYRREGGGGSVVLSPGMLILAVAAHVNDPFGSKRFFQLIQTPIQETLHELGLPSVHQRGISDLAIEGRKILGSSMRRKASLLLYQAVLLVDVDRGVFARYLQHPPKEPDYREGRPHSDFTICLREAGYTGTLEELQERLQGRFDARLPELLGDELRIGGFADGGLA